MPFTLSDLQTPANSSHFFGPRPTDVVAVAQAQQSNPGRGFTRRFVTRGFIVDWETNERVEFVLNPNVINSSQSIEYADMQVVGLSHPPKQYVGGGPERFDFTLWFDRGLKGKDGIPIEKHIKWLNSFKYPSLAGERLTTAPHRMVLSFGASIDGLLCVLVNMSVYRKEWFPDLTLRKCEIQLTVERWIPRGTTREDEWRGEATFTPSIQDLGPANQPYLIGPARAHYSLMETFHDPDLVTPQELNAIYQNSAAQVGETL